MSQEPVLISGEERLDPIPVPEESTTPTIDPEVLAIAEDVIARIGSLIPIANGNLIAPLEKRGKKTKLNRSATIRHVIPKGDVESKAALLELALELQKKVMAIHPKPEDLEALLQANRVELNIIRVDEVDEERGIRFIVDNDGRYDLKLKLSIFKLKDEKEADQILRELRDALALAEKECNAAQKKYQKAQRSKDLEEKIFRKKLFKECRRRVFNLEHRLKRVEDAKKKGKRYIDEVLCIGARRTDAGKIITGLIEEGKLTEVDREVIARLFHRATSRATGMPDINVRFAIEIRTFYNIIKRVHEALKKMEII